MRIKTSTPQDIFRQCADETQNIMADRVSKHVNLEELLHVEDQVQVIEGLEIEKKGPFSPLPDPRFLIDRERI